MQDKNFAMAEKIAGRVAEEGGRTYYVGGLVRDRLMGRDNKDVDIEVHGIPPAVLYRLLEELGKPQTIGISFGVYGMKGYDIDIAMPRKETATGRGHKDFDVYVDPFLGTRKAAVRRDFTINAMMQDVLTGEIVDHFGGQEDLKRGRIRHVNDVTFVEDPLRVLRAAQFAARFHFEVAEETIRLAETMDLTALAKERIEGELEKALLKSDRPSIFFEALAQMKQLEVWFPEVLAMKEVPQDPIHHPEGNLWNHTMLTLDAAASLVEKAENPLGFMLTALVHDFGKICVTETVGGHIHAYGHEQAGLSLVKQFLDRICNEVRLQRYVLNMTEYHMRPNRFVEDHASRKKYCRMFDESVCPEDLLLIAKADHMGRKNPSPYEEQEKILKTELKLFRERMALPYVQGRDLVENGLQPGPRFHDALEYAHKLRLAGVPKESALKQTISFYNANA